MSKFKERFEIPVSKQVAWKALAKMNIWLPVLSTNQSISYDDTQPFFTEGMNYKVTTKEGIQMNSVLYKIDTSNYKVEIHANFFFLKSILFCQVIPVSNYSCYITRTQIYPGIIGKIFAHLFNKREGDETAEYLEVWGQVAINSLYDSTN